ncbi:hypothetical protein [Mycobacteroides immunogenum]|uniref:Uncharacterized protein n=1 Tax=Mycobacteroides immunogenum TaxID=83262 RepID=A0A7V8RU37_9MYCO|nr:hypothetical protein [Mycobacteroides immunogenum]AMT72934.1 hypothetical protein ABG82_24425 [Mycobacteroides immunogenum]ANO06098.1 hypothetical protein BAB75_24690 [Mycobacteroides immunogenum]KIU37704.1 hypothetical protein TL11_26190 [Mycobacteroides immunogenum]KPG02682.1 hypothetical protein AN909_27025 [Mycobacteroides immunogenum]KPG02824.1 hypothetical protein AN908_27250 [Mycobacteroides immunogenum]
MPNPRRDDSNWHTIECISGFGESVQDDLKAIQDALTSRNATADDIAKYAERIQTASQVMDEDPKSVGRGGSNLVRTGLIKNYTQSP